MSLEAVLAIAAFAISLGGLVSVLLVESHRKEVALAVVVAALVATSGVALYRLYQHDQLISRVQEDIVAELSRGTRTFDQLYEELLYVPFPVVSEALFRAVESGAVDHRIIEFRGSEGSLLHVRGYYVTPRNRRREPGDS